MSLPLESIEGKYEILHKLNEGGMGTIYKVRHRLLDEVRVIKVMQPKILRTEELKTRFLNEARAATQLRHPNIATLFDLTIDENDVAYMVMEFIDGLDLAQIVGSTGALSLGLALEIGIQSLDALSYLHDHGFVHRDIAPDNLMLVRASRGQAQVKLIDLGLAKSLQADTSMTSTGLFVGKVRYSSPEQFEGGGGDIDGRADLYSFGVVFYELLTGIYPITGESVSSLIAGHVVRSPRPFSETDPDRRIPVELQELVLKALAKEPEERPQSAAELRRRCEEIRSRYSPVTELASDLEVIFKLAMPQMASRQRRPPGSTQERLDLQFGSESTPVPARVVKDTPVPVAPAHQPEAPAPSVEPIASPPAAQPVAGRLKRLGLRPGHVWVTFGLLAGLILIGLFAGWVSPPPERNTDSLGSKTEETVVEEGEHAESPSSTESRSPVTSGDLPESAVVVERPPLPPPVPEPEPEKVAATTAVKAKSKAPVLPPKAETRVTDTQVEEPPAPAAVEKKEAVASLPVGAGQLVSSCPGSDYPTCEPPVLLSLRKPKMPSKAKRQRLEGLVVLSVLVDENGKTQKWKILEPAASEVGFEAEAVKVAKKARFKPATVGAVPVKTWYRLKVAFSPK